MSTNDATVERPDAEPSRVWAALRRLGRALWAVAGRGRLAAAVLLIGVVALRAEDPDLAKSLRFQVFDGLQQIHPRALATDRLLIVDIDEASIAELGQWPWSRQKMAEMVDALIAGGALSIGFDIVFSEPDRLSPRAFAEQATDLPDMVRAIVSDMPDTDETFAAAISRGPVVLGFSARAHATPDSPTSRAAPAVHVGHGGDPRPFLFGFPGVLDNIETLTRRAPGVGFFSLTPEHDGVVRRVPMALRLDGRVHPSLTLEMLRIAQRARHFGTTLDAAGRGVDSVGAGAIDIPTDRNARAWVHFSHHRPDLYVSAADILDGSAAERIAGKFVLIGTSAVGLRDIRLTPLGESVPGVEVHAQIIDAALAGDYFVRPAHMLMVEHSVAIVAALLLIIVAPMLSPSRGLPIFALVVGGAWAGAYLAFAHASIAFDPTYPTVAAVVVFAALAYASYARAEAQRRQIRSAFSQYLSPALVARLADSPDELRLGGESREMTFLFCDIAGFTGFVEKTKPETLVALLNEYLDGACGVVMDHGGTIDKIVGDAIHAMFNAPLDDPDHAANAVRCALAVEAFTRDFRDRKAQLGVDFGKTRIGVNTGPAVVGNFGGARRFDYTAHGDAINTAARLEGVNKHLGTSICVSETTVRRCPDMSFRPIGALGLVGKDDAVGAFEPVRADGGDRAPLAEYAAAFGRLGVDAGRAIEAFRSLASAYPKDPLVALHLGRLQGGETTARIAMASK